MDVDEIDEIPHRDGDAILGSSSMIMGGSHLPLRHLDSNKKNTEHRHHGPSFSDSDIMVSRYSQKWKLMTSPPQLATFDTPAESATRIIRVRMEMDLAVTATSTYKTYKRWYKSIALSSMDIKNLTVIESFNDDESTTATVPLSYELEEKDFYQFIRFDFRKPLTSQSSTSIVVAYDLIDAIEGCREKYQEEGECSLASQCTSTCTELFAAPWANQWKLPVIDATYQFEIEADGKNFSSHNGTDISAEVKENWITYENLTLYCNDKNLCDSSGCEVTSSSEPSLVVISCSELNLSRTASPERPVFLWSLRYNQHSMGGEILDFAPHCRAECHSNDFTMTFFTFFGNMFFAIMLMVAVSFYVTNKYRRREAGGNIMAGRPVNISTEVELALHGPTAVSTDRERMKMEKEDKVRRLPMILYGANDDEVIAAIHAYHGTHRKDGDVCDLGGGDGASEEEFSCHQQLVASAACNSCSICISDFGKDEEVRILPRCGHVFHHACIQQWLVEQNSEFCPLCQSQVILK